jgi:glycosyltransferase involved in cell wall biosynthesis
VARVLLAFEPPDGGVAVHVGQLALGLARHGHRVEVAGPAESIVAGDLRAAGVPLHPVSLERGYRRPDRDAAALGQIARLLRRGGHDLLHCHASKAGVLGRGAAALARVPAVYTPHCFGFIGDVGRGRRVFATAAEWVLGRAWTAALVCVCEAERGWARGRRLAPERRLRRIYPAVEACDADGGPDPALAALRGDGPLAGTVVVLREQKRVDLLIAAAPVVLERVPEARIAVVGAGRLRERLEAQARELGLDADPRFGFVDFGGPDSRQLAALDLFVLSSAWEAMPMSVLEALSCGVPQVATDVGGTREAVTPRTGVLVPPRDADALAEAMVDVLADPQRRADMARASRERYDEVDFGVERMVAETAALYDEVLRGR